MYKSPFYAITKATKAALSELGLPWYDSSVPPAQIIGQHKHQDEIIYGILGASQCDTVSNKDTVVWSARIDLEVYSNYKGRLKVSEALEGILNKLETENVMGEIFKEEGYVYVSVTVDSLQINQPIFTDIGAWQSGGTSLIFTLQQIK